MNPYVMGLLLTIGIVGMYFLLAFLFKMKPFAEQRFVEREI